MITVRCAIASDLPWLMIQLKAFSKFHGSKRPLLGDEEYAQSAMASLISGHLVLIACKDEQPMGFIAGMITPHVMNPGIKLLVEMFWWVPEEHRRSRAGLLLLNAFTEFGENNADWVLFTLEHHSPVSERCLIKRGYQPRERSYLLEVS